EPIACFTFFPAGLRMGYMPCQERTGPAVERLCTVATRGGDAPTPGPTVKIESVTMMVSARAMTVNDSRLEASDPTNACTLPVPGEIPVIIPDWSTARVGSGARQLIGAATGLPFMSRAWAESARVSPTSMVLSVGVR